MPGEFDVAFIGFFWSHVLRADVPRFLRGLHARLESGARLVVLDNAYVPGSSTPISRTDGGDTYQARTLAGGDTYEILKNFPTRAQFTADVGTVASDVAWTDRPHYWLATCTLR